ncbi:MAG: hypothetical protein Q4P72_02630 [Eubacteriales bacterium]|nr:hypothetical protein [Eubacteriales bacterium]
MTDQNFNNNQPENMNNPFTEATANQAAQQPNYQAGQAGQGPYAGPQAAPGKPLGQSVQEGARQFGQHVQSFTHRQGTRGLTMISFLLVAIAYLLMLFIGRSRVLIRFDMILSGLAVLSSVLGVSLSYKQVPASTGHREMAYVSLALSMLMTYSLVRFFY